MYISRGGDDWLIDQLIDLLIDWLIDWLIGWMIIGWQTCICPGLGKIHWFIDWLNDWLIDWKIKWLVDWLSSYLTLQVKTYLFLGMKWLFDWLLIDWLPSCLPLQLTGKKCQSLGSDRISMRKYLNPTQRNSGINGPKSWMRQC